MGRLRALLALIVVLEVVAFAVLRNHPLKQPAWYDSLIALIKFLMCWGGVEAARWLLRDSPAARYPGPDSDWVRLWLWVGPPGGALLALGCLAGWWLSVAVGGRLVTYVFLGHFVAGALVWLAASPWVVPAVIRERPPHSLDRRLLNLGMALHGAGFAVYAWVYPATARWENGWKALAVTLGHLWHYYFVFFSLLVAAVIWSYLFGCWRPPEAVAGEGKADPP